MNCACELDSEGNVVGGCGAHAEWARKQYSGVCSNKKHDDFDLLVKNALYQTKRADRFEKIIVNGHNE